MIFIITFPIAIQNLISFGVSVMDTIMVGKLGDIPLAACAQATQPGFVYQLLIFGLSGGGAVLCSQYWGKNDLEAVRKIVGIVIRIAVVVALLLSAAAFIFTEEIMRLYLDVSSEDGMLILPEAVKYLKIISFSYFFFGVSMAMMTVLRSIEIVRISMLFSLISFAFNVFFNWVFIFGNLGAPKMGIRGAAMATLIARVTEFLCICVYVFFKDDRLRFRLKYIFIRDALLFKDFVKYSVPVLFNELAWGLGMTVQAAIIGRISKDFLAANAIVSQLQQLSMIVSFGVANAAMVVIGKKIGEGDKEGAKKAASIIMIWSAIFGIISMVLIFLARTPFVSLFNVSDQTKLMAKNLLIITSIVILFVNVSCIGIVGVLRGAGDTRFSLYLELFTLWLLAVPLGVLSGLVFKAPVYLVYICLRIDEPVKATIAYFRTKRDKTYKTLTR